MTSRILQFLAIHNRDLWTVLRISISLTANCPMGKPIKFQQGVGMLACVRVFHFTSVLVYILLKYLLFLIYMMGFCTMPEAQNVDEFSVQSLLDVLSSFALFNAVVF